MLCYPIELFYSRPFHQCMCPYFMKRQKQDPLRTLRRLPEMGKTSKLRRSVILFYQYDRRDVMRKRSITRGIPSGRVLMGVLLFLVSY